MPETSTIELPRLENESARAYAARVEYVTAGPQRSLEAIGQKLGKSKVLMERWSSRYGWVEIAKRYDADTAYITIQEAQQQRRADLEAHRKRAMDAARSLYSVAGQLTIAVNTLLAGPRKIKGADGNIYTLHNMEFNANTFQIASRAFLAALDLEAHALGVDTIMHDDDNE